jgi:hypothetical protein
MKRGTVNPLVIVLLLALLLSAYLFVDVLRANSVETTATRLVQVQCLRSEPQEEHVFLDPQESVIYNASEDSDGLGFVRIDVQLNSTSQSFLREVSTDLYIESYDYFGGLGGWTANNNFTITNPTTSRQELFLKIVRNYLQTTYAIDTVIGKVHTIEFTSEPAANRVFVRWDMFAALKYLEVNQSDVDFSSVNQNLNSIRVEFLPSYLSFQLPAPQRIQGTHFLLRLEERDMSPPSGYCYISAFILDHKEITLGPHQEFLFDIPKLTGWNYLATSAYTNLTASLYPQPYPFQLVNMSVWDSNENPLLTTALDVTFGVRNLSNETYSIGFDILYYYWQNQTGLTFSHEIIRNDSASITHEVLANVSDANIGADLGLSGQYLLFQVPGKTTSFQAPDPVGKFEKTYIPLRQGFYKLVTRENKIVADVRSNVNDLLLSNTLNFRVTYDGDAYANAEITVTQSGTFTNRTYSGFTDQNGGAEITVYSNGPELGQLSIKISKDEFNYIEQTISYVVGVSWLVIIVLAFTLVAVLAMLYVRKRRKQKLQTQT